MKSHVGRLKPAATLESQPAQAGFVTVAATSVAR
jgi:hypothetical protein